LISKIGPRPSLGEIEMPVIVVTRLRLKDPSLLNDFFTSAVALLEQAQQSDGNLGSDVLADAHDTWWTCTAWRDRSVMRTYVHTDPHHSAMARLADWCDEATFVDWDQSTADLPDWQASYHRIIASGQAAKLTDPSPVNETREFPPPVEQPAAGS
jgi:quinol monooxygenase YgiN